MVKGKWTRSRLTPGELVKDKDEGAAKNTCRYLRDKALNGEAASVYNSHGDTEGGLVGHNRLDFQEQRPAAARGHRHRRGWQHG
jgi:hypothetical protein